MTFPRDPIKFHFKYKYCLQIGGKEFSHRGELKHGMSKCKEQERRIVKHQFQFDVFIFPDNIHREGETISKAAMCYTKWLLKSVDSSTISPILTSFQNLDFTSVIEDHNQEFVCWILEQVLQASTTDIQGLYLFMVLCHFRNLLPYLKGNNIACDRFLQCFLSCIDSNLLSKSDPKRLKKTAITLVENSTSPGWLTLAAYFYSYLGIKFLLDNKDKESLNHRYDSEDYRILVKELFSCLKVESQDEYKILLKCVVKSAPTFVDAMDLFQRSEISEIFATEDEKVDFFAYFFKEENIKSKEKKNLWERLVVFHHTPEKIRSKVYKLLYSTLLEYAKSGDEFKDVDIKVLVELILSIKQLGMDQFINVLNEFSTSKSSSHQDLLPQILDDKSFKEAWLEIPPDTKVDICKSWIMNRVITMKHKSELDNSEMVVLVYQSIETITQCCSLNTLMTQNVSADVVERVFESKDPIYVLHAFESIEKLSPVVKECYISHVKKILTPELVKKSSQILKKCSKTR